MITNRSAPLPVASNQPTPRLLVINPNTSTSVTALIQNQISQQWALGQSTSTKPWQVEAMTARFGPAYISSETAYAIASHACLDAWATASQAARSQGQPLPWDGILIGCFGDPGLLALRETAPIPVTGLAEAAFATAARHGRFGIVTGGERWKPMLQRLAQALHYEQRLAAISTVSLTGAQLMADRAGALRILQQACEEMLRTDAVDAIIIGGAALAGMAADMQAHLPVPLIDSVHAGTHYLCEQIQTAKAAAPVVAQEPSSSVAWTGLSAELSKVLAGRA